jgi:hypothetical protein
VSGTDPYLAHPSDELLARDMQLLKDQAYQSTNINHERMIGIEEAEEWSRVQALKPRGRVWHRPLAELADMAYHLESLAFSSHTWHPASPGRQASPTRWLADDQQLTVPSLPQMQRCP